MVEDLQQLEDKEESHRQIAGVGMVDTRQFGVDTKDKEDRGEKVLRMAEVADTHLHSRHQHELGVQTIVDFAVGAVVDVPLHRVVAKRSHSMKAFPPVAVGSDYLRHWVAADCDFVVADAAVVVAVGACQNHSNLGPVDYTLGLDYRVGDCKVVVVVDYKDVLVRMDIIPEHVDCMLVVLH